MIEGEKNSSCPNCGLTNSCGEYCIIMGTGNRESKVMFVSDTEDAMAKNGLLQKVVEKVIGKNLTDYYYTSLIKHPLSEGRFIEKEDIASEREYLEAEIESIKPTCIITFGAMAMEAMTGVKGITAQRGKELKYLNDESIIVIPTFSPQYVDRRMQSTKSVLEQFAKDINKGILASQGLSDKVEFTKLQMCSTIEEVKVLIEHIKTVGQVALDFETEGLDYKINKPTVLGASFQMGSGWCVPLHHFDTPFNEQEIEEVMTLFKVEIWENRAIRKLGQNFKFDLHFANAYTEGGINPISVEDIMLMHHIIDENARHGLKSVGPTYFPELEGYEEEVKQYKWAEVPLLILAKYCVVDTDLTLRLSVAYELELMQSPELYRLYRSFANPAMLWTFEAEKEGMLIDRDYLVESIELVTGLIDKKEKELREYPEVMLFDKHKREVADAELIATMQDKIDKDGTKKSQTLKYEERIRNIKIGNRDKDSFDRINFGSSPQLGELIYEKPGFNNKMPYVRDKRKEAPSTDKDYLGELPDPTHFIKNLLEWRRMKKLHSTYFIGILDRLDTTNRLHTDFLVHGTTTGRMSSKNPNLQNIPRKGNDSISEIAQRVKNCFIAPEGYIVMQADYSQAELRLVAEYAKEDTMIAAYAADKDLHSLTARTIKRMSEEDFESLPKAEKGDERFKAKAANFGLIYGMQADSYQEYKKYQYKIHSSYEACVKERHLFFKLYPKLISWHKRMIDLGKRDSYVTTLFGRRRRLLDIHNTKDFTRSLSERNAINAPIQGTGGEYTVFSGAILKHRIEVFDSRIKMVNTVHDSIIFYIPKDIEKEAVELIKSTMENPPVTEYFDFKLNYVSMKIDCEIGDSWGTLN